MVGGTAPSHESLPESLDYPRTAADGPTMQALESNQNLAGANEKQVNPVAQCEISRTNLSGHVASPWLPGDVRTMVYLTRLENA